MVPGDSDSLGFTSSHPLPTNTRLLRLQNSDKFWFSLVRLRPCLGLRCRQLQLIATVDPTISVNWLDSLQGTEPLGTGRPKSLRRAQNHRRNVTHIAHEWTNSFPTCKRLKVRHERHAKIPLSLSPWTTSHLMIYIKFIWSPSFLSQPYKLPHSEARLMSGVRLPCGLGILAINADHAMDRWRDPHSEAPTAMFSVSR